MEHVIKAAVERGASDLHIKAGDVFRARINGELQPLTKQRLTPDQTKAIALQLISSEEVRQNIDTLRDYDCSWGSPGIGRFRVNVLRQRSSFMVVMRVIPFDVPTFDKLQLPAVLAEIVEADSGIVMVTGPTGSGRSSTVAAMIHHINTTASKHIVSLESPIEFLHRDLNSSITQREVGVDTESFASGFEAALRQDPDVMVAEEIHDDEIADIAITAAETGRLVISTMHNRDSTSAIARLVGMFPAPDREAARFRVAETLQAVVCQRLIPRADGGGLRAVVEVLRATPDIKAMIQDRTRAGDIAGAIEAGQADDGMQSFDQHLRELVDDGVITTEVAHSVATNPDLFVTKKRTKR